jgi:uncharacterized membrane protein
LIPLVESSQYNDCNVYGNCKPISSSSGTTNNYYNNTYENITIINGSSYNESYVPYIGATTDVNLGSKNIIVGLANLFKTIVSSLTVLITGNLQVTGNITTTTNTDFGYYNNGTCIVIGDLAYATSC